MSITFGLTGVAANTVGAITFFRHALGNISIVAIPTKAVVPPFQGHSSKAEGISRRQRVDGHIAKDGGGTVAGVPT